MRHILLYTVLALAPLSASAQTTRMNLQECVNTAINRNLTLKSGRIAISRAEDLQRTAVDLESTGIALSQTPTDGGGPENAITFSQTFELPMVYTARHALLKAQTGVERSRLEVTENEMRRNVASAYWLLVYMQERLRMLQRQDSVYNDFRRVAQAKLSVGETGQLESMNAERLARENTIKCQNAERDCQSARLLLMQWMNTDEEITPADEQLEPIAFALQTDGFNAENNPLGSLYSSEVEVSEQNLRTVKRGALPTISLAASTQMLIKGFNPYNVDRSRFSEGNFMGFEVGVNIPLAFWAQKAKVKAAKKEVEMANAERDEQMKNLEKTYKMRVNDYLKAKNSLDYYRQGGLKQAYDMVEISRAAYEQGSIDYIELIQNIQTAADIRMNFIQAVNDYNQAVIELNYLQGNK